MKICSKCKENREFIEFGKDRRHRDGLQSHCSSCQVKSSGRYYGENREKVLVRRKARYERNREQERAEQKKYSDEHKEEKALYDDKYRKENRDKRRAAEAKREAAKLNATPVLTKEQKQQILEFYVQARKLTEETGIPHEVDHIIPLQGKKFRGLHIPSNLQVITREENVRKSNKFDAKEYLTQYSLDQLNKNIV